MTGWLSNRLRRPKQMKPRLSDQGQAMIFVVVALAVLLLILAAFGVETSNLWLQKEIAQGAADSACQAAIADLKLDALGQGLTTSGFVPGVAFDCTTTYPNDPTPGASPATPSPCRYATLNGFNSPGLKTGQDSNQVTVTFPTSLPGIPTPPAALAPVPFVQVFIVDRIRLFFGGMLGGTSTRDVRASATCGLLQGPSPAPVIVLHPSCSSSLDIASTSTLAVQGGPNTSVQVNSTSTSAVAMGGVDLHVGGPTATGSYLAVFGGPSAAPTGFSGGSTGGWISPATPAADPFKLVIPPLITLPAALPSTVFHGTNGCPDLTCTEYHPGLYLTPIVVNSSTAIFDPGVYMITGTTLGPCASPAPGCTAGPTGTLCRYGLAVTGTGVVRPSTAAGDGSGGTMFYFSGLAAGAYGSVYIASTAGTKSGVDAFNTSRVPCPLGKPPSPALASTVTGNVLLGPCGGTYGGPLGLSRGMLFYQDRSNGDQNGQPLVDGSGGLLLVGNLYFHHCPSALLIPCGTPGPLNYQSFFQFKGSSSTTVVGSIITDELVMPAGSTVNVQTNQYATVGTLNMGLIQ